MIHTLRIGVQLKQQRHIRTLNNFLLFRRLRQGSGVVRWDSVGCIQQGFANVSIQINEPYRCIAPHLGFLESIEAFIGGMEIPTGTHVRDVSRETRRVERDATRRGRPQ